MKFSHVFLGLLVTSMPSVASDNFDWLRDDSRQDERVLSYLKQQNQKTEQFQKRYDEITQNLLSQWEAMATEKGEKLGRLKTVKNGISLVDKATLFCFRGLITARKRKWFTISLLAKKNVSISKLVNGVFKTILCCLQKILMAASSTVLCWLI